KKFNAKPVSIVTSAIRIIASNDPSPWSGEKPNHLSIKSTWLHSPEKQATIPYVTCWCRVNLLLLKLDLGPTASAYRSYGRPPLPQRMSALPPKADMYSATTDVRFGPKADIAVKLPPILFYRSSGHDQRDSASESSNRARSARASLVSWPT